MRQEGIDLPGGNPEAHLRYVPEERVIYYRDSGKWYPVLSGDHNKLVATLYDALEGAVNDLHSAANRLNLAADSNMASAAAARAAKALKGTREGL